MISIVYSLVFFFHPVHVSVSEINYNEKSKSFQITSRIFIDELELGIREKLKQPELDILEPKNGLSTKQMVSDYVLAHFKIKMDGKAQKINFLGIEQEDVAMICYLEIENVKKLKTLEVFNNIITEIHEDQSNLVHVTYKSPIKSARLMRDKPSELFKFQN